MMIDAFERHAVQGKLAYDGIVSMEVSIRMPLELFEETCTAGEAANEKPLQVMEHEPDERGCKTKFSLYRNDAESAETTELIESGTRPGPNNAQTMPSND